MSRQEKFFFFLFIIYLIVFLAGVFYVRELSSNLNDYRKALEGAASMPLKIELYHSYDHIE
jgi:hypothetical protein